jgi:hypothetical protein
MEHLIVTRCHFKDDEGFQKYFSSMKKYYIPSINSQTDKNFKIALIVNSNHYRQIRDLIDKEIEILQFNNTKKDYREYVINNNITIQTRHDCDDYMSPNYIKKIHDLYEKNKTKYESFVLNFHPYKHDSSTGKDYVHSRDYSRWCSMFSTLIQQKTTSGVFDVMHDQLSRITKNIIYIPANGDVKLIIHENNIMSKIFDGEQIVR